MSLTVGKLKVVVERLFKVKQAKQALFLQVSSDDPCPENIGDQEDRELYYFGIQVTCNMCRASCSTSKAAHLMPAF